MLETESKTYDQMANYIVGQSPKLCRGIVSHAYITQQIRERPDYLFLAMKECQKTRSQKSYITIMGFAMVFATHNSYYIDVICTSQGYGSRIIRYILQQAKMKGIRYVSLSAVPYVIKYYSKLGFVNTAPHETCGSKDMKKRLAKLEPNNIPEFLYYLISKGHVRKKWCLDTEQCSPDGYPMTWCNPAYRT